MMELVETGSSAAAPFTEGADVVALDTETTGLWWGSRLVELAAVRLRGAVVVGRWSVRVHPEGPIPARVTALHGLGEAEVASCAPASAVLGDFRRFVSGAVLVAHNAAFDRDILAAEYVRAGLAAPDDPLVCSLALARRLVPESPRFGLHRLGAHLGLPTGVAHRALDDATLTLDLWQSLRARMAAAGVGLDAALTTTEGAGPVRIEGAVRRLSPKALTALGHPLLAESLGAGRWVRVAPAEADGETLVGVVRSAYARGDEAAVDLVVGAGAGAAQVRTVVLGAGVRVGPGP